MRINHITAFREGGAGIAARRLHDALVERGMQSQLFFGDRFDSEVANIFPISSAVHASWDLFSMVRRAGRYASIKLKKRRYLKRQLGYFSMPWQPTRTPDNGHYLLADILHLHWIARLIDMPSFFQSIPRDKPIVWTLHDMNPVTGGCHHSDACLAYQRGCGKCPMLRNPHQRDLSRRIFETKAKALHGRKIHVVTPSRWLERIVRSSAMMLHFATVRTIYNGIETNRFQRIETRFARRKLGIDEHALVLGYGADSLTNKRKGIDEFIQAMRQIAPTRQVVGLIFGKAPDALQCEGLDCVNLGFLATTDQLVEAYSAMDVFVSPTYAEILGQAILEASACETPVVAFDVGGVSESVIHQKTGLLVPPLDVKAMIYNILWLADHPDSARAMGQRGRERVVDLFDAAQVTEQYLQLYWDLVDRELVERPA